MWHVLIISEGFVRHHYSGSYTDALKNMHHSKEALILIQGSATTVHKLFNNVPQKSLKNDTGNKNTSAIRPAGKGRKNTKTITR